MIHIRRYATFVTLEGSSSVYTNAIHSFCGRVLNQLDFLNKTRQGRPTLKASFYIYKDGVFHIHIGALDELLRFLKNIHHISKEELTYETVKCAKVANLPLLKKRPGFKPYDYQDVAYKHINQMGLDIPITLTALATGMGKTISALYASDQETNPVVVIVKPSLIDQWSKEAHVVYKVKSKQVCVVRGAPSLKKLMKTTRNGRMPYRFIIIANATYRSYVNQWIRESSEAPFNFDIAPLDLFPHMRVRRLIIDEAHKELHSYMLIHLLSNIKIISALSATMLTKDPFVKKMQSCMYPVENRYDFLEKDSHIYYLLSEFEMPYADRISVSPRGRTSYSHIAFEKSILARPSLKKKYMEYITSLVDGSFMRRRVKGDKVLVLFSMVKTIEAFVEHLKGLDRFKDLNVKAYGADNVIADLDDIDVIVSTGGKIGLGVDVPGLIDMVNTLNVDSLDSNIQYMGRLRKPKMEFRKGYLDGTYMDNQDRLYIQATCVSLAKHVQYNRNRLPILDKYIKTRRKYRYQYQIM